MTEKSARVLWTGAGKRGLGQISTETGALMDYPYGFASRFGDTTAEAQTPKRSWAPRTPPASR